MDETNNIKNEDLNKDNNNGDDDNNNNNKEYKNGNTSTNKHNYRKTK